MNFDWENYSGKGMENPSSLIDFVPRLYMPFDSYSNDYKVEDVTKRALDIGCGVGATTEFLRKFYQEVYAVDIVVRDFFFDNKNGIHFNVISSGDLSQFEDNFFDLVFCWNVTVHITRKETKKYIEEAERVSKRLVLFQFTSFDYFLDHLDTPLQDTKFGPEPHIGYCYDDVLRLFSTFDIVKTKTTTQEDGSTEIIILARKIK